MRVRAATASIVAVVLALGSSGCGRSRNTNRATVAPVPGLPLLPGTERRAMMLGGNQRTYLLHRPAGLASGRHPPLVVVLHGATLTADQTERYYRWDGLADAQGFAVAYPQGVDNAWNAGSCCGDAPDRGTDDVGFIAAVIAAATAEADADPSRRYLTGVSNGAMMTLRYQCERPSQLAAVGSVAGTITSSCDHPSPVPFVAIHGLDDKVVTFAKSSGTEAAGPGIRLPAVETVGRFLAADHCGDAAAQSVGAVHTETASCAPGYDVEVITIDGAGHQWPGASIDAARLAIDGPHDQPSQAIDATAVLWSFFARHVLGQPPPPVGGRVSSSATSRRGATTRYASSQMPAISSQSRSTSRRTPIQPRAPT